MPIIGCYARLQGLHAATLMENTTRSANDQEAEKGGGRKARPTRATSGGLSLRRKAKRLRTRDAMFLRFRATKKGSQEGEGSSRQSVWKECPQEKG
jgi:hypothetical protein